MVQPLLTCEWCGVDFERPGRRGPPPKYCSRGHRQRAYEKRTHDQALLEAWLAGRRGEDSV